MGLSADNCIAIEYSLHGLQVATALGIKTFITVNGYTQSEDFSGAILVLNYLGEKSLPFYAISGDVGAADYLNLDLLRRLHSN
jgi:beta-phosphoglucomutase-like phosphatase (HAD superfamily)